MPGLSRSSLLSLTSTRSSSMDLPAYLESRTLGISDYIRDCYLIRTSSHLLPNLENGGENPYTNSAATPLKMMGANARTPKFGRVWPLQTMLAVS